jgi:stringent starvation protein B
LKLLSEPTTTKPYLLRALYEWCVDNGYTPYIAVVVNADTRVPLEYVRNGEIVLNIGPLAANKMKIGNDYLSFSARFGGVAKELFIPVAQISAIYARENGQGMSFEIEHDKNEEGAASEALPVSAEPSLEPVVSNAQAPVTPPSGTKPSLRIVK